MEIASFENVRAQHNTSWYKMIVLNIVYETKPDSHLQISKLIMPFGNSYILLLFKWFCCLKHLCLDLKKTRLKHKIKQVISQETNMHPSLYIT